MTQAFTLITPSSVAVASGASATINPNGSIDFTNLGQLDVIGCFSSAYDDYHIQVNSTVTAPGGGAGTSVRIQTMTGSSAYGTSAYGFTFEFQVDASAGYNRGASTAGYWDQAFYTEATAGQTHSAAFNCWLFSPYKTEVTLGIGMGHNYSGNYTMLRDSFLELNTPTSFDGIRFNMASALLKISGTMSIYGFNR